MPNDAPANAPLQMEFSVELKAPQEQVFAFISDFSRLPEWMPTLSRVDVDNTHAQTPGGVGAVRQIRSPGGKRTYETVKRFEPPSVLAYSASDASLMGMYTNHLGVLTCEPVGNGHTRFRWLVYATPARSAFMRVVGKQMFSWILGRSVKNLQKRFGSQ